MTDSRVSIATRVTGELEFAGCLSGRTSVTPCVQIASATPTGADSGLDNIRQDPSISADGSTLYTAVRDDSAVARFTREPDATGPLLKLTGSRKQRGTVG